MGVSEICGLRVRLWEKFEGEEFCYRNIIAT